MRNSDIAISIRSLTKAYTIRTSGKPRTFGELVANRLRRPFHRAESESFLALNDVSFDVAHGEVVGIVGRNGAGKSTLLKLLSRITEPTAGNIKLFGRVGSLLEVGTGFHPELTGRENIFLNGAILGMTRAEIRSQFDAIVDFAEVSKFLETPVKRYSSGMYVRLAFAVAAHLNPEILIIDEVLAVGDAEFQKKCMGKMKDVAGSGRTVLFVSHNMGAVKQLCTSAILLVGGKVHSIGEVERIVSSYLDQGSCDEVRPDHGPLRRVQIRQHGDAIIVEADWAHDQPLRLPHLGFVIYDFMGAPIVGANPFLGGIDRGDISRTSGRVTARLTEPRLLDGEYHASIWFGDGAQDFVELPKCISFEVRGMAGMRQLSASIVGPVAARCDYQFEGAAVPPND